MNSPWHNQPEFLRAPNISSDPNLYELENLAADPDRTVEAAMQRINPWKGKVVLDVGAGTGFHIERFHADAAHVIAVEPDAELRLYLLRRLADMQLKRTSVIGASAADIPLRDNSIDIAHARFAYFFGPGCEPGLAELERIVKPGGTAFIVDNDLRSGTFASWVRDAYEEFTDDRIDDTEQFWSDQGFTTECLSSKWRFSDRDVFEQVIHLEFPSDAASRIVENHPGLEVDYNLLLIHRTYA